MAKSSPPDRDSGLGKLAATGLETAVGVGLGYFVGHWLDDKFGWSPWGVLVGILLGLSAGTYLLLKDANR